jgi:hypothetical protein
MLSPARHLVALLLLLLLVPKAWAQQADAPPTPVVIDDGADDVKLMAGGVAPQDATATGQADDVDVRSVTFGDETEKDFTITLHMKTLPAQPSPQLFRAVYFELDGVKYRVLLAGPGGQGTQNGQGALQSYDEGVQRYRSVGSLPTQQAAADGKVVFTVPRELVTNKQHVAVRHGDHLMNLYASATKRLAGVPFLPTGDPTGGAMLVDRGPDSGFGDHFLFVKGRTGSGNIMLSAPEPIRVSNGEATTIVYKVEAMNHGDREASLQLEAVELEPAWNARVPSLLRVAAGETVTFPVILSLPFTHNHGKTATFELKATSLGNRDEWSSVRLGVYWTETPQPAGHHPQMWLHSSPGDFGQDPAGAFATAFPFRATWINPLETEVDPDADDGNVPAFFNNELAGSFFGGLNAQPPSGSSWTTEWFFPMAPALLIGLDFDVTGTGKVQVRIKHAFPAQTAQVVAELYYCDPEKSVSGRTGGGNCTVGFLNERWSVLAHGASATTSASPDEVIGYEIPLQVDPAADYLPYKHGANIGLRLMLKTNLPANTVGVPPRPELVLNSGGTRSMITLPLIEYHDPIDQALQSLGNLVLERLVPEEKKVNPGETTVFRFKLGNDGDAPEDVQLEIHGEGREWARIVGEDHVRLAPRSQRTVELAVTVPSNVAEGNRAELVLLAQSLKDPAVVALARLRATVVESEDVPDEASSLGHVEAEGTPGPTLVDVLALAAVAVVALRRHGA